MIAIKETEALKTPLDFIRYAVTQSHGQSVFFGHGTDNPWDEFRWLVLGALHLPFDLDDKYFHARLTLDERKMLTDLLKKRIEDKIPVPYLLNKALFCGLEFYVDERVLIPRSPISELIENHFQPWIDASAVHQILDLCTGSGCIAIALAYAFEDAVVDATDISTDALAVAKKNVKALDVEDRVSLIQSDVFDALPLTQYDLIVSNPPYVSSDEMKTLPQEYAHEPTLALETGNQGMAIVDRMLQKAANYLSVHGLLVVEVGNTMPTLAEAYPDMPFTWLEFERGGDGVFLLTKQQLMDYFKGQ